MKADRRRAERHPIIGMMASISDGRAEMIGVVENVSRKGIHLSNIPASFGEHSDPCVGIVNAPRRNYLIVLQTRWTEATNSGMYKRIGFQIQEPPESWDRFIDSIEKDTCGEDPYCAIVVNSADES